MQRKNFHRASDKQEEEEEEEEEEKRDTCRNKGEQIQLEVQVSSRYSMLPFNFFFTIKLPSSHYHELAYYCRSRYRKFIESGIEWKLP